MLSLNHITDILFMWIFESLGRGKRPFLDILCLELLDKSQLLILRCCFLENLLNEFLTRRKISICAVLPFFPPCALLQVSINKIHALKICHVLYIVVCENLSIKNPATHSFVAFLVWAVWHFPRWEKWSVGGFGAGTDMLCCSLGWGPTANLMQVQCW